MPKYFRYLFMLAFVVVSVIGLIPFVRAAHASSSGTFTQYTYNGSAGSRPYYVYTPANYQPGTAVPLIVMLHGCTQNPTDFAAGTQMNALADQKQFIVVYPQQTSSDNSSECWNWFQTADQARGSGEPAIIAGIVQTVEQTTSQWTVDTNRVYVAGMSAGAAMSVIMGATYPDIFAAMGEESGLEYQAATSLTAATTAESQGGPSPSQQGQAAYNAMGSAARVVPTISFQGTQVPGSQGRAYTTQTWNDNNGNEIQEYWKITGMGHAWSGGSSSGSYTDPNGPSATNAMYTFFMNHPMHGGSTPTPTPTQTSTPTPTPTSTPTQTPTPTPSPTPTGMSCQIHYGVINLQPGNFQVGFTITNTGTTAINSWTLKFSFANGQKITQGWNGIFSQSGSAVTITNTPSNGSIPAGSSLSVPPGFQATDNGTNSTPTSFTLNGVACSIV